MVPLQEVAMLVPKQVVMAAVLVAVMELTQVDFGVAGGRLLGFWMVLP